MCVSLCAQVREEVEWHRQRENKDVEWVVRVMWEMPPRVFLTDWVIAGNSKGRKRDAFLILLFRYGSTASQAGYLSNLAASHWAMNVFVPPVERANEFINRKKSNWRLHRFVQRGSVFWTPCRSWPLAWATLQMFQMIYWQPRVCKQSGFCLILKMIVALNYKIVGKRNALPLLSRKPTNKAKLFVRLWAR